MLQMHEHETPLAVDVETACRLLGIGKPAFYKLVATGALRSYTVGRSRRVRVAEIERFMNEAEEREAAMLGHR